MPLTVEDAARLAMALPEVTEGERHGGRTWRVNGKVFLWERSFSKADLKRFGDAPVPDGIILAASVSDVGEKKAVLAANPTSFFTIPHFDGYSAVLVQLTKVSREALEAAIVDAWLASAPARLAKEFANRPGT
jgi:hypothetical protein